MKHSNEALWTLSATELYTRFIRREISATEATESALNRLQSVNGHINAVVGDVAKEALQDAAKLDEKRELGEKLGPLAGVPITIKINIDQKGHATTNGLQLQKNLIAQQDSPVVENLKRAGAIIIGRTNTPAFSMRWFTRNSLHGHTRNPINKNLTPGGSSGGAASAVAAGIGAIAHGTDIAGSIRYPAYACGIHGLRPTLGRIAAHNASAADRFIGGQMMAVSGPLARNMADLETAFHAMAGGPGHVNNPSNARDPWWMPVPLELPATQKRAAMCLQPEGLAVDTALISSLREAAQRMQEAGWEVVEIEAPPLAEAALLNMQLWMAEMKSVAHVVAEEGDLDAIFVYQQLLDNCAAGHDLGIPEIMQRRATLLRMWQDFLTNYPILLCPVSGELPFKDQLDTESAASFKRVYDAQMPQIGLPFLGLPGLSVATGFQEKRSDEGHIERTPLGVQLVANRFREDKLIEVGKLIEGNISPSLSDQYS